MADLDVKAGVLSIIKRLNAAYNNRPEVNIFFS